MGKGLGPDAYCKGFGTLLTGDLSVDLSSPRIHQEGGVVDDLEDWRAEAEHCLVVEWSACNRNREEP